jgi:tight adherence protein B
MNDPHNPILFAVAAVATGITAGFLMRLLLPVLDRLTDQFTADLTPQLIAVHADTTKVRVYLRIWSVALVAVPVLLGVVLGMPVLAVIALVPILLTPRTVVRGIVRKQRTKLRDQLVSGCTNLANTVRAGLSFLQGLENVLDDTPEPLAYEFRRIVNEVRRGRPLVDTLQETQERLNLEPFTLFSTAVRACYVQGGNMTEALDRISTSLLENQRLERKLEAETAAGQKAVRVLAMCPLAFLGMFSVMDPEGFETYSTAPGQVVLGIVLLLDYVSVRWARAILKLDRAAK